MQYRHEHHHTLGVVLVNISLEPQYASDGTVDHGIGQRCVLYARASRQGMVINPTHTRFERTPALRSRPMHTSPSGRRLVNGCFQLLEIQIDLFGVPCAVEVLIIK